MKLPCLLTVEKDIYTPRLPSYRLKAATKDRKVEMITFAEFKDQDVTHYGLKGSATSVERIFPPESHDDRFSWMDQQSRLPVIWPIFLRNENICSISK